jgi:anaerobic magnesium-protoporphyrin IX monomethyl ester cyclase
MNKVLVIDPPNQLNPTEAPRPQGSLGPLYLVSALEDAGIEVDFVDASVGTAEDDMKQTFYNTFRQENGLVRIGMSPERIRNLISVGGYDIVAIHSNFTPQTRMVLETARIVREVNPKVLIITGGVNARNMPEYFLRTGLVDLICSTEGERIIVKIVKEWRRSLSFDGVDGIIFIDSGRLIFRPAESGSIIQNLDDLPMPAWHKLLLERYAEISSPHGDVVLDVNHMYAPLMTSRGCPFRCIYCHISLEKALAGDIGHLRFKSVGRVIQEFEILRSLGVEKVYIEDDSLLAKKARVREILKRLLGAGLKIADANGVNLVHLFVRDRVTGKLKVDQDYLELFLASGFGHISFPIESGSQRILDKYATSKLNLDAMDLVELVRVASRIGISCPVGIMIGFPDETEQEIMQSVELGRKLVGAGAKYCSFYIPIPFPGSRLYQMAIAGGYLDSNFDTDAMNWHRSVMRNTVVPPERILELKNWAWRSVNDKDYVAEREKQNISNM